MLAYNGEPERGSLQAAVLWVMLAAGLFII